MGVLQQRGDDDEERAEFTITGLDDLDSGAADDLLYELDEWSDHDRTMLRDRLETLMLPHRWEDTTLVVAPSDEAWVERVMDQVEEDLAAGPEDDDDEDVVYDLSDWDDDACMRLLDSLAAELIPYGLDDDDLIIHGVDERRVDQLVAQAADPSLVPEEGPAATLELMSELFIAADRLAHDHDDHEGTRGLVAATEQAAGAGPPFGMDATWWRGVATQAGELAALVTGDDAEPEQVQEAASALRSTLRPYI
ncbi:MAG: hypothetical protein ACSLFP_04575 [Acidimicrobiales bacterium]